MARSGQVMRPAARLALWLAMAALMAGCGPAPGRACLLASQHEALSVTLFFGRDIPGRAPLRQQEWRDFAAAEVAPRFPEGFTVFDGSGAWRDPRTGRTASEDTTIVQAVMRPGKALAGQVAAVAEAYRSRFHQQAVGVVSFPVCAAF